VVFGLQHYTCLTNCSMIIFRTVLWYYCLFGIPIKKLLRCGIKLYLSHSALTTALGKGLYYRHICLHDNPWNFTKQRTVIVVVILLDECWTFSLMPWPCFPSRTALQQLLDKLYILSSNVDMICNSYYYYYRVLRAICFQPVDCSLICFM